MLLLRSHATSRVVTDCHQGHGSLTCFELLADYRRTDPGIRYVHDDILLPGCMIGEHLHQDDEELYFVVTGTGVIGIDGVDHLIGPGDGSLVRSGQRHALTNTGTEPLRLIVVNARSGI